MPGATRARVGRAVVRVTAYPWRVRWLDRPVAHRRRTGRSVMTDTTTPSPPPLPREVRLASRPVGWPTHEDFALVESEVPELADGQIRVRNTVMSVDPYMRGRMSAAKSYAAPYELGEAMTGGAVGVVEESAPRRSRSVTTCCTDSAGARSRCSTRRRAARSTCRVAPALGLPRRARDDRPHGVRRTDPHRRDQARATSSSSPGRPAPSAARSARSPRRSARAGSSAAPARPRRCATSSRTSGSTRRSTTRTGRCRGSCARPHPTASTCTSTTSAVSTSRPPSGRYASAGGSPSAG